MENVIKILVIEDEISYFELYTHMLIESGMQYQLKLVGTEKELVDAINDYKPDVILSDYSMPDFNGKRALEITMEHTPITPFIFITGEINEEIVVELMSAGATDYLIKTNFSRFMPAIIRALEKKKIRQEKDMAENLLRANEERLRTIINSMDDTIFILEKDIILSGIYGNMTSSLHLPLERAVGRTPREAMGAEIGEKFEQAIKEMNEKEKVIFEWSLRTNRREFHFETIITKRLTSSNEHTGYIGVCHDITLKKNYEISLKKSEEEYRSIFENSVEGMFKTTRGGKFLKVNPSLVSMLGYDSAEELIAIDIPTQLYLDPADREVLHKKIDPVSNIVHSELQLRKKSGDVIFVKVRLRVKRDDAGEIEYYEGIIEDISDRIRYENERLLLEEQIKRRNVELESTLQNVSHMQEQLVHSEKMASLGQLTAGIAHEINNPLAFVSSNINRFEEYFEDLFSVLGDWHLAGTEIKNGYPSVEKIIQIEEKQNKLDFEFISEDYKNLLVNTKEGLGRIKKIVEELRVFSHKSKDQFVETNLNDAISDTITIAWNEIKYKATIEKYFGHLPPVMCIPGEIKQVFLNLLVNASHAITEKGVIRIKTYVSEPNVVIEISDNGCGIKQENLKKIFDPFYTTKAVGKGTGLGLWISSTIIYKHKGTITVNSQVGQGTTFIIQLPKEKDIK